MSAGSQHGKIEGAKRCPHFLRLRRRAHKKKRECLMHSLKKKELNSSLEYFVQLCNRFMIRLVDKMDVRVKCNLNTCVSEQLRNRFDVNAVSKQC